MNLSTEPEKDYLDDRLRQLVEEMVANAPSVDEVTAYHPPPSAPGGRNGKHWWVALAAASLILVTIAVIGSLARPQVATVATEPSTLRIDEQTYRWTASTADGLPQFEGVVDPQAGKARVTIQFEMESWEVIDDGETLGSRYEGNGELFAIDGDDLDQFVGRWFVLEPRSEFESFLAVDEMKTLDAFEVDVWEDLGTATVNGVETQHLRTVNKAAAEVNGVLDGFVSFFAIPWDGALDVWVRDDGALAQIVLFSDDRAGRQETMSMSFLEYGVPVEIAWPDGAPPTQRSPTLAFDEETELGETTSTTTAEPGSTTTTSTAAPTANG